MNDDPAGADWPSAAELAALADKYRRLCALRARRDAGGDGAATTRAELRGLAAEFPGCLRELDTLGAAELGRRGAVCAAVVAAAGGDAAGARADERWIAWIAGYHALMRRALAARAGQARGEAPADHPFERAALAPPEGRMGVVVLQALASRFGVPAATIAAALFPLRRPSPYRL